MGTRGSYSGKWFLGVLAGLVVFTSPARAFATTGAEFLRQESSPNAAWVMAGAAQSEGSSLMVVNPAGILGQDTPSLSLTHFASFVETAYEQIECLAPLASGRALAARVFFDSTYNLMEIDEFGEQVGSIKNYDLLVHAAYAMPLVRAMDMGVGVKLFQSVLAGYESVGAAVDLGLRYQFSPWPMALGFSLQNLGGMTAYDQEADALPLTLTMGGAWQLSFNQHQVDVLLDLNYVAEEYSTVKPAVGLQYRYSEHAFIKAAYRFDDELGNLMIGAGVRWQVLGLDYSFQPYGELGDNHRFTLSYFFKPLDLDAPDPAKISEEKPELQAKPLPVDKVPELKILPRTFLGKITIVPGLTLRSGQSWQVEILDGKKKIIRTFSGQGKIPDMLHWDGTDQQGQIVASDSRFLIRTRVEGKIVQDHFMPLVDPAVLLQVPGWSAVLIPVTFSFHEQPKTQAWQLLVADAADNSIQAVFSGNGTLPSEQVWMACQENRPKDARFSYQLSMDFADKMKIVLNEPITTVYGELAPAPAGYTGIKIKGILFDFDRAELKPAAADKLRAAGQILSAYQGKIYAICEGHADEIGDPAYNQQLSEKRAHMVANKVLENNSHNSEYVTIHGYGKTRPENTWGSEEGRAQNRRVEILLFVPQSLQ